MSLLCGDKSLLCSDTYFIFDIYFCSPFAHPTCWVETIGRCRKLLGMFLVRLDIPLCCAVIVTADC